MATKKLTVELDAQTAKAQQQIRKAVEGATAEAAAPGGGIGGGANLDLAAERTAKSFEKLDRTAEGFDKRMLSVTRAFAGLAVGMATSYASRYFAEGSGARKAMDYGGAAITGASAGMTAGMALGPYGAAAGAIIGGAGGLVKTGLDKSAERSEKMAEFEKSEKIYESMSKWQKKLGELSESLDVDELNRILANLKETEQTFIKGAKDAIEGERYGEAETYQRNLGDARNRQSQIEALLKQAEKKDERPAFRESMSAVDSLSRLGGNFGGGGDVARDQLKTQQEQLNVLKRLEEKQDKKGSTTWQ